MNNPLKRFLKTKIAKVIAGIVFSRASFLIPVKRLRETDSWMAFNHPHPSYPVHIVIIPKRRIANWLALPIDDLPLYSEFIGITLGMIRDFCLEEAGYRLIINGGKYQSFPQLHFHLVAGEAYSDTL